MPTEKINLDNGITDFTAKQIPLNLSNPTATVLDTAVDVFFRIGEKRVEKTFVIRLKNENAGKRATVTLYGVRSVLENLRAENLQVELVKDQSGQESLQLIIPAEIQGQVEIRQLKTN